MVCGLEHVRGTLAGRLWRCPPHAGSYVSGALRPRHIAIDSPATGTPVVVGSTFRVQGTTVITNGSGVRQAVAASSSSWSEKRVAARFIGAWRTDRRKDDAVDGR
jgi:hypothetical protein